MSLIIINKDNKDHEQKEKKHYIILEQNPRMYLCEAGFFIPQKELALAITNTAVAVVALEKVNALRISQKMKVLCTVVVE